MKQVAHTKKNEQGTNHERVTTSSNQNSHKQTKITRKPKTKKTASNENKKKKKNK